MSLLQAVVAVGLAALVLTGGMQYVSGEGQLRAKIAAQADGGFSTLESAHRARQSTGAAPPATADWQKVLFPTYGNRPADVRALGWSYGNTAKGVWFCLSGPLTEEVARVALDSLSKRYAPGLYDVTRDCEAAGGAPDQRIAATLWMQRTKE